MIIAGVADRVPERLRRLVFLDALIPTPGKSAFDILPKEVAAQRRQLTAESASGLTFPDETKGDAICRDARLRGWFGERITPHPIRTYEDALTLRQPFGNGLPIDYIACTLPANPKIVPFHELARRDIGWTNHEIAAAHDAMIDAPSVVADLLVKSPAIVTP